MRSCTMKSLQEWTDSREIKELFGIVHVVTRHKTEQLINQALQWIETLTKACHWSYRGSAYSPLATSSRAFPSRLISARVRLRLHRGRRVHRPRRVPIARPWRQARACAPHQGLSALLRLRAP